MTLPTSLTLTPHCRSHSQSHPLRASSAMLLHVFGACREYSSTVKDPCEFSRTHTYNSQPKDRVGKMGVALIVCDSTVQ